MKNLYYFHPQLVLRTPARPFTLAISEASMRAALGDEGFMEAIYLASPTLHAECGKWQRAELKEARKVARLRNTLTRYYVRFMSRSTPFGLFAGCSVLRWGATSCIEMSAEKNVRHTRLDMHYLCALAQHIAVRPDVKHGLRYWPNTSSYRLGNEIRYAERQYSSGVGVHQVCALEASETLLQVLALARPGRTLANLVSSLLQDGTPEEVIAYIEELISAQVLVSELEPTVTGVEFFQHIQTVLRRLNVAADCPTLRVLLSQLMEVQRALARLDEPGANAATCYEHISALLTPLGIAVEAGKLFQTDTEQGLASEEAATLDVRLQATLQEAITVLTYLSPPSENPRLTDFIRRFQARYEDQEVSLLEALDTESGLAYSAYGSNGYSALVHDLVLPEATRSNYTEPRTEAWQFLHQKLREAERTQQYSVDITKQELQAYGLQPNPQPLPPSVGILFRLIDDKQVLLENVGGSSAVNLLGRFAHASPAIEQLIQQLTQHEQAHNPGVRFAEICHLPTSRVGNLLQRPHFRALEIPYLAQSTLPPAEQLLAQDLYLAVRGGQLILRSRQTNQLIIPRLSTAHNFMGNLLPVYQLLCDLQTQGVQSHLRVSWDAGLVYAKFTPRLTCRQVVLLAATWRFDQADLQELVAAPPNMIMQRMDIFRVAWNLPRFFTLADGDNELLVDAQNELLIRVWLDAIRTRLTIVLKEFLFEEAASPVRDAAARPFVSQFLALLVRKAPCYGEADLVRGPTLAEAEVVQREFSLGSEWLYYKLYCGQMMADRLLVEVLQPLNDALQAQGLIDRWFFIRYADPDNHLRVRWHLPEPARIGEVISLIREYLAPVSSTHYLWKIQTDTYRRELERYGRRTIVYSETLFCHQSQILLKRLAQATDDGTLADLWLWGLEAIDELLNAFEYSLDRKVTLLEGLKEAFAQEFGMTKELKQQLDVKYRHLRPIIQRALAPITARPLSMSKIDIAQKINRLAVDAQLEIPKDQLLTSYIHMLLNRLIPADARLHEMVLYDFLFRHYQSAQAQQSK